MIMERLILWGKKITLKIQYDCYEGEEVLPSQEEALRKFLTSQNNINESKNLIIKKLNEQYFEKNELPDTTDLYKYLQPVSLFIKRNSEKHIVAIMCESTLDEEHGIAIVFENEQLKAIGTQDIVL